ncbi:hypothetical protein NL493_25610 [Klebsiella pneumoniae]|nr:hypothetical protein [Klebsiella pneumoniae]
MSSKKVTRPRAAVPTKAAEGKTVEKKQLSSVRVQRNVTTSEKPKTVRFTAAEKMLCREIVERVQLLTTKNITDTTLIRAALYILDDLEPEQILEAVKEHL